MISFQYILGFSLGTPIFQQYNIFSVEKHASVHLVALI